MKVPPRTIAVKHSTASAAFSAPCGRPVITYSVAVNRGWNRRIAINVGVDPIERRGDVLVFAIDDASHAMTCEACRVEYRERSNIAMGRFSKRNFGKLGHRQFGSKS